MKDKITKLSDFIVFFHKNLK